MNTQHEMLGAAPTMIPVQQTHQVPTYNQNVQTAQQRNQGFGVANQKTYDNMHGEMNQPLIQQQQQQMPQQAPVAPQWSQPGYAQQQPPIQQIPTQAAPVQHTVNQAAQQIEQNPLQQPAPQAPVPEQQTANQEEVVPAPAEVELTEEETQKIKEEGEETKAEIEKQAKENPNSFMESLLERLIDEGEQGKVSTLQAKKESAIYKTKLQEMNDELNELKYNSNSITMQEQGRGLAVIANKYYSAPDDTTAKEKYVGKILNTLGELTGTDAFGVFDKYIQGGKRVVANMSGASGATAQEPTTATRQQYQQPQGVVRKPGSKRRRF